MSRYPVFDRSRVRLQPIAERAHDLWAADCLALPTVSSQLSTLNSFHHPEFPELIARIRNAREIGRPVVLMIGGHPIKLGLSRFLIDLIERRWVTHLAMNGAGIIHDFELALVGGTSENVAKWIQVGQFGLWEETSILNDIAVMAAERGEGFGEAVGRAVEGRRVMAEGGRPAPLQQRGTGAEVKAAPAQEKAVMNHRTPKSPELSVAAAGWRCNVPVTVHVSIGSDIVHAHPNCNASAIGRASDTDFLIFANAISQLEGGVFLNIGSAVTGPEVYLKALSMARNVARQEGREIRHFTTAVFDLVPLPPDYRSGTPGKDHAQYYYRPWKTILVRTVADGGQSFYFCGDHRQTIPTLWRHLVHPLEGGPHDG